MSSSKFKNSILLPGQNAISEVLTHAPTRLSALCIRKDSKSSDGIARLIELAKQAGVGLEYLGVEDFDSLLAREKHQGAVGVLKPDGHSVDSILELSHDTPQLFLVLDRVQDTNNLGSLFRLAASAGASGVFLTKNQSAQVTPTVRRISMGGTELVPWCVVGNLAQLMERLKKSEFWVYGATASEDAVSVYSVDLPTKLALVMGSEEAGLRRLTAENCDMLINIPMGGELESLNVSQAASVLVFEVFRQWGVALG